MDTKSAAALKGKNPGRPPELVRIEITRRTVANNSPRGVGEVLEVPRRDARTLIALRKAKLAASPVPKSHEIPATKVPESKPDKK